MGQESWCPVVAVSAAAFSAGTKQAEMGDTENTSRQSVKQTLLVSTSMPSTETVT